MATDTEGCTATASVVVSSNNVPFGVSVTSSPSSCVSNTGSVTASATAGTSPYTYLWNNADTAHFINNLGAGNYQVTVTDAHGCSTTAAASVTTASGPSATDSVVNVLCNGDSTGSVIVTVTGGTGTIVYAWNNGSATQNLTNIGGGNYTLTITDANNCSFTVAATISQPAALSSSSAVTNVLCNGDASGSIDLTVSGGVGPYSYTWYCCAGTNVGGGNPKAALAAGDYSAIVTDSNGCRLSVYVLIF